MKLLPGNPGSAAAIPGNGAAAPGKGTPGNAAAPGKGAPPGNVTPGNAAAPEIQNVCIIIKRRYKYIMI